MHEWRNVVQIVIGALLVWRAGGASNIEIAHTMITIGGIIIAGAIGISLPAGFAALLLPQIVNTRRPIPPSDDK